MTGAAWPCGCARQEQGHSAPKASEVRHGRKSASNSEPFVFHFAVVKVQLRTSWLQRGGGQCRDGGLRVVVWCRATTAKCSRRIAGYAGSRGCSSARHD